MAKGEERRRSARLSDQDTCKGKLPLIVQALPAAVPPQPQDAKRHRGKKKRLLLEDEEVLFLKQARKQSIHEDDPPNTDRPLSAISCTNKMHEKWELEHILDMLQRRDTHDIFAEPVNPIEVLGYNDIIKDPMDFGTMRTKLHEGIYTSLELFENDVNLISKNAMHFNASTTIYFRQARVIDELAREIFNLLRGGPEKFEDDSSLRRGKLGRRPQGKSIQTNPGSSMSTPHFYRSYDNLPGSRDGKRTNLYEAERRSTGNPWASYLSEDESISSTVYNSSKSLVPVNQKGFGYKESLMRFVSDLGPTAQLVANRKLNQCQVVPSSQFRPAHTQVPSTSSQRGPAPSNGITNFGSSSDSLDKLRKDIDAGLRRDKVHQTPISEIQLGAYHCAAGIGDLNFPADGMTRSSSSGHSATVMGSRKSGSLVQPTELDSQSRLPRFMPRNNDCHMVSSWPLQEVTDGSSSSQDANFANGFISYNLNGVSRAMTAPCSSYYGVGSSVQGSRDPGCSQPKTKGAQSVLNLSFLQSQLSEMNSSNQGRLVQPELQLSLAPETEKQAFIANSSHQRAPGWYSHDEAGPSNAGHSFSASRFQERAQVYCHQESKPREVSFNAFSFPQTHQTELSAEESSFIAQSFHERTPVQQSYLAALGADSLFTQERSPLVHAHHQAELISSTPRGLSFDAIGLLHERASPHSLSMPTELMMNSPMGGLSFNAANLQERTPVHFHQGESSAPVVSFNEVSLRGKAPMHSHRAEGPSWFHNELNPVVEGHGGLSVNAAPIMSFHERLTAPVPTLQVEPSFRGQSLNPPIREDDNDIVGLSLGLALNSANNTETRY